jgi:hypothetical protein
MKWGVVSALILSALFVAWTHPSSAQEARCFQANVKLVAYSSDQPKEFQRLFSDALAMLPGVRVLDEDENYIVNIINSTFEEGNDSPVYAVHCAVYTPYNAELPELLIESMLETKLDEDIAIEFWRLLRNINHGLYRILFSQIVVNRDLKDAAREIAMKVHAEVFAPSRALYNTDNIE